MNFYSSKTIKDLFLNFFKNKNHSFVESSPVIPIEDNTLLFTNAGMNQFKDFFTGIHNAPYNSAVSAQNCIRAGGKHNDLSEVGYTERHLTHFVMLGNFTFNNTYFKKEAITFAWEFLTKALEINKELLFITVYNKDEEAYNIWKKIIGIPEEKIYKLGEKDNFWFMGDSGPCGPCSEIYFDRGIGSDADKNSFPSDSNSSRFIEIWNLVFMEYEKINGNLIPLKNKGVDTGMGLERLASVLQKKKTIFETDCFTELINFLEKTTGVQYNKENAVSFHVLADHARTTALLLKENLPPSNEGRGYVLRKIIRRALLFSKNISLEKDIFEKLVLFHLIQENNNDIKYINLDLPELLLQCKNIRSIKIALEDETNKFFDNLEKGITLFKIFLKKQSKKNIFNGKDAFILYDTYGFPLEITEVLARQSNLTIDIEEYEKAMKAQKERSKISNQELFQTAHTLQSSQHSLFDYNTTEVNSKINEIFIEQNKVLEALPGQLVTIIPDKSTFYPTGGGQIHDQGRVIFEENNEAPILNVKKYQEAIGITFIAPIKITIGQSCRQIIDTNNRIESEKHHSATHLLFAAIKNYFNDHSIEQAGSFVCNSYLSIDIKMKQDISQKDRYAIQNRVNEYISLGKNIHEEFKTLAEAQQEGATATFTEKYNREKVRVIVIDNITRDLCGGCHAKNTGSLGLFILKEISSAGTGIKRFIGLTGMEAYRYLQEIDTIANELKQQLSCPIEKILFQVEKKQNEQKEKEQNTLLLQKELSHYFALWLEKSYDEKKFMDMQTQLPKLLSGCGKEILSHIKINNELIILYSKKENQYEITGKIPNWDNNKKNIVIELLKKEYKFKGYLKGNIFQGIIDRLPKNNFFEL